MKEPGSQKFIYAIHIAVLLFGFAALFGKIINQPAIIIVFGRVLFASIFLFSYLKFRGFSFRLAKKNDIRIVIVMGALLAFHWLAFFKSVQLASVSVAVITFATFPVFTLFLEPMVFKTKLEKFAILFSLITFFGIFLLLPEEIHFHELDLKGIIWGLLSGLSFSILSVYNRKLVQHNSSLLVTMYETSVASLVILPFAAEYFMDLRTIEILYLILLGTLFTAIAHSLFVFGMKKVKAQTASLIALLEPVYGILFALLILGEQAKLKAIIGGVIILGISLLVSLKTLKKTH